MMKLVRWNKIQDFIPSDYYLHHEKYFFKFSFEKHFIITVKSHLFFGIKDKT